MIIHNRPIIPCPVGNTILWYPTYPITLRAGEIFWADGSWLNSDTGLYRWPDATTGHAAPQDNTITFGTAARGWFKWDENLWAYGQNIYGDTGPNPSSVLKILDKDSNVLSQATFIWLASAGHTRGLISLTYGSEILTEFNAIQNVSISAPPWPYDPSLLSIGVFLGNFDG